MVDLDIIEPVQKPTYRVNGFVVLEKPNGKFWVSMSQTKVFEQSH